MESQKKNLPVIDFTLENLSPGSNYWDSVSKQVMEALENYGCFIAKYGNDETLDLHNAMCRAVEDLFDLPLERKLQNLRNKEGFGYNPIMSHLPLFEAFILGDITPEVARKFANKIWPNGNDKFCEVAVAQGELQSTLYKMVMKMVFEKYNVEKYYQGHLDSMDPHFGFIKYKIPQENESNVGLLVHKDKSFVDLIDQNYVKGLEIETKDGEWIVFDPTPSHYVFIAGEAFKAWSNGRIYSPFHRVMIREKETKYTFGLAMYAHGTIETPPELVDEEHPLKYKPFSNAEFLQACIEHKYDNPPYNIEDFCGIKN